MAWDTPPGISGLAMAAGLRYRRRPGICAKQRKLTAERSEGVAAMKFAYMPDTHGGPYDQPLPDRERCAKFCEHLVREAVTAEQAGYDGVFVPERHARTETMWPQPLLALMAMAMKT